jgi:hypothetical protein
MIENIDRRTATRIIFSLAESGQPPKLRASALNVGTDAILKRLRSDYLEDLLLPYDGQDGGGACKWVEANYGNGKTQFLRCMQEQAWELNYVSAFVELSQDECPLDRPERVYGAIARSIQARPLTHADIDRGRGLDIALQQLLDRMFPGVLSGNPDDETREQAIAWVETSLAATPVESTAFRTAAVQHLLAKLKDDAATTGVTATYLRGEPLPAKETKEFGVYEKLDKASGFRFLRSMCQLFQRSGLAAGTALLFDEARRSLSLMSGKSQKVACENLLNIINRCNSGELPGTLFLYAVMPEFFTDFATAYPALQQRCGPATRINLEQLRGIDEIDLLREIGERITAIFRIAYDEIPNDDEALRKSVGVVAQETLRQTMVGSGTRRLMVKTWVQVLHEYRDNGIREISAEEAERIMEGAKLQLDDAEAETVNSEGE